MELNEPRAVGFRAGHGPSGLDVELAALREHVVLGGYAGVESATILPELRRAVQLCSVGLGELAVRLGGVPTPASAVVAGLDLEPFVERRIRGWTRLN